jgi:hypothetical protein
MPKTPVFLDFPIVKLVSFLAKTFLVHFLQRSCLHFEIRMKRLIFLYLIRPIQILKKLSSLIRDNEPFWELKGQKRKKLLNISKYGFYKQVLDFHCLSKILRHIKILKFCQNTGPYWGYDYSSVA